MKPTAQGQLEQKPLPHLLLYIYNHKLTGSLILKQEEKNIIYFQKGYIAKVYTYRLIEPLGKVLVELGKITPEEHQIALTKLHKTKKLLGQILQEMGCINKQELVLALQEQFLRKLVSFFQKHHGTYIFYKENNLLKNYGGPEETLLDPYPVITRGIQKFFEYKHIHKYITQLKLHKIKLKKHINIKRFKLQDKEKKTLEILRENPNITLETLEKLSPLSSLNTQKLISTLFITQNLEFQPIKNQIISNERKWEEKAKQIQSQNFFERLELPLEATPSQIQERYLELVKKYHPDRISKLDNPTLKKAYETIFSSIHEAYETLKDNTKRREYIQYLKWEKKGEEVFDEQRIIEGAFNFQKAEICVAQKKWYEAQSYAKKALQLVPEEGEHHILWAWIQWNTSSSPHSIREKIIQKIKKGLQLNPKSKKGHLFLGKILKSQGKYKEALEHLRIALNIAPKDVDVLREIKMIEIKLSKDKKKSVKTILVDLFKKG